MLFVAAAAMLLLPSAAAEFPKSFGFKEANLDAAAVAVDVDIDGTFAAAITGDDTLANVADDEVYVYRLASGRVSTVTIPGDPEGDDITAEGKTALALSHGDPESGVRYMVAAGPDEQVYFYQIASCRLNAFEETDSRVLAVDISKNGATVVVGTAGSGGTPGRVWLFEATGAGCSGSAKREYKPVWSYNATGPVNAVAVSDDGNFVVAGAGQSATSTKGSMYLFKKAPLRQPGTHEPVPDLRLNTSTNSGAVTEVAVTSGGEFYVFGTARGEVLFFSHAEAVRGEPWSQELTPQTDAGITALAISRDGDFAVVGDADGFVHFIRNLRSTDLTKGPLAERFPAPHRLPAQVTAVGIDDAGEYAVASGGRVVAGFHLPSMTISVTGPAWTETFPLNIGGVAISGNGKRLVAATSATAGNKLFAYEQFTLFNLTSPTRSVTGNPDEFMTFRLNVSNTGSLLDTYRVNIRPPAGWDKGEVEDFSVRPGASVEKEVRVKAPVAAEPSVYNVTVNVTSVNLAPFGREVYLDGVIRHKAALELKLDIPERQENQGQEATFPVQVVNNGNGQDAFRIRVQNQADLESRGWEVALETDLVTVDAKSTKVVSLKLTVPADAPDGETAEARVVAESTTTPSVTASATARVVVNPAYSANLIVTDSSVEVLPGRTAVVRITIENTGNTRDAFLLDVTVAGGGSGGAWAARLSDDRVELAADVKREVTLSVTPPANAVDGESVSITITAESEGGATQVKSIVLSAVVAEEGGIPGFAAFHVLGILISIAVAQRRRGIRWKSWQR